MENENTSQVEETQQDLQYPYANVTFTDGNLENVLQRLNELRGLLPPLPSLTPLERRRLSKLGSKTRGFADHAIEASKADPGILPQSITSEHFVAQDQFLRKLGEVHTHVAELQSQLDDAIRVVGNYVYGISRVLYALMKTPAAKAKLLIKQKAMKQRFAYKKSQTPKQA